MVVSKEEADCETTGQFLGICTFLRGFWDETASSGSCQSPPVSKVRELSSEFLTSLIGFWMLFVSIDWRYFSSGMLPALTLRWVLRLQCISSRFNLYIYPTIKLQGLYEKPLPLKSLLDPAFLFRDRPLSPINLRLIRTRFTWWCAWYKLDYELLWAGGNFYLKGSEIKFVTIVWAFFGFVTSGIYWWISSWWNGLEALVEIARDISWILRDSLSAGSTGSRRCCQGSAAQLPTRSASSWP